MPTFPVGREPAFQPSAFQNDAFQMQPPAPPTILSVQTAWVGSGPIFITGPKRRTIEE